MNRREITEIDFEEVKSLSRVQLFETPWTVAYQAPQSMEFSRQEYWSGLPFPPPGDLPNPGIEPGSPTLQADALPSETQIMSIYHWQRMTLKGMPEDEMVDCITNSMDMSLSKLWELVMAGKPGILKSMGLQRVPHDWVNELNWIYHRIKAWKKQESSRKTSISALLTMPKPLTVWITINFGEFWKRWEHQPPDQPLEKSVCRSGSNS